MTTAFDSLLRFEKTKSARVQITDAVRELLISKKLSPGEKLPSTKALADSWGTDTRTVHSALTVLKKEGLLVRMPRSGTFVREREEKLTCVGVHSATAINDSPYLHAVREALREELHKDGIEMDLWTDTRPPEKRGEAWEPLVMAAEKRQFQAFIGVEMDTALFSWQRKLPVPMAFQGGWNTFPNSVSYDLKQFIEIGLRELARQGCRSVGFISPILDDSDFNSSEGLRVQSLALLKHFMELAGELGLTVKNEWMRLRRDYANRAQAQEHFGYEQFLELWDQPEKPEGLLAYPDTTVRGILMGIQGKNIRVPEDLKVVLHKNESLDLLCPMPATFVVSSERDVARALIEQVQKQFRGESCERISLPFKLEAHIHP